jgi:hypothetical protein
VAAKDEHGNVARGDVILLDTEDSLVFAETRMVSCLGLKDMVVVETSDAVMIAAKDRTQDVKRIVAELKTRKRPEAENHRKVYRPWGYYDSIDAGPRFQVKRIVVNPGARCRCRCITTAPSTGSWSAARRASPAATRYCCCPKTNRPTFRWVPRTGWRTPASCRSK